MSKFELPSTWHGGANLGNLTVEVYRDRFSAYWSSNASHEEFFEGCEGIVLPEESRAVVETNGGSSEGSLEEILQQNLDTPTFIVVYDPDFSVSWESINDEGHSSEVSVASEEPHIWPLPELFLVLEDNEIDECAEKEITSIVEENVTE